MVRARRSIVPNSSQRREREADGEEKDKEKEAARESSTGPPLAKRRAAERKGLEAVPQGEVVLTLTLPKIEHDTERNGAGGSASEESGGKENGGDAEQENSERKGPEPERREGMADTQREEAGASPSTLSPNSINAAVSSTQDRFLTLTDEQAQFKVLNAVLTGSLNTPALQSAPSSVPRIADNAYARILASVTWEHPVWTEPIRGILITLVDQYKLEHGISSNPQHLASLGRNMIKFRQIAAILANQDKKFSDTVILEKWAWLCEMNYRSHVVARRTQLMRWRFANAMKWVPLQKNVFVGVLSEERFTCLCGLFENTIQDNIMLSEYRACVAGTEDAANALPSSSGTNRVSLPVSVAKEEKGRKEERREPTIREVLSARKPMTDARLLTEFERLCGLSPSTDASKKHWGPTLVLELIEAVAKAPGVWDSAGSAYRSLTQRRDKMAEIAARLRRVHGGEWLNEDECLQRWTELRLTVAKVARRGRLEATISNSPLKAFYQALNFIKDVKGSDSVSPPPDEQAAKVPASVSLAHMLGTKEVKEEVVEADGDGQGKSTPTVVSAQQLLSAGINISELCQRLGMKAVGQVQPLPQAASPPREHVWVPPREDEVLSERQGGATATATVVVKPLEPSSLLPKSRRSGDSAPRPTTTTSVATSSSSTDPSTTFAAVLQAQSGPEDKWTLLGRLIAQHARELERDLGPAAGLELQKEVTDMLCRHYGKK